MSVFKKLGGAGLRVLTGAAVAAMVASSAIAETKWDMPTPYGAGNFHTENISQFAADVAEATGGNMVITVHPGGSLIKHPEIKNAVRSGQVPIGEFLLSRLSNENAIYAIDSVPFLANNYAAARKLWEASRGKISELLAEQGLMVLYAVPWPPQGIYAKVELDTIDGLKGIKFRAYNASTERFAQLVGAIPTQIEAPDIAQAFSTGRVDAMITSPSTGANSKAWDFLSHYHDTQAWMPKNVVVVNKAAFDALDEDIRNAILAAAKTAEDRGWEASVAETDSKTQMLRDNGLNVVAPSDALMSSMREVGDSMTNEWLELTGADGKSIVDAYKAM
ncbi:MAG: TRAP transporter substrate-binding protein [Fimbriimonadaceae bacterium]|nr:TRAP transporter substrate-binding protein [Alphaproteobacteria bacterium]